MKKTNNNVTELVFILDRSGSMAGFEDDTIGGFNSMLKEQKENDGKCYVSTVLFNDYSKVIHDRVDISNVKEMTSKDYRVSGCTALIDALGDAINHIKIIHKYIRPEDVPSNTLFVITTDGMENASHKYSSYEVKKMIEQQKENGWEFVFVAANIDAVETAKTYGINENRAVNYVQDHYGNRVVYGTMCNMVSEIRSKGCLNDDCLDEIKKDYSKRK